MEPHSRKLLLQPDITPDFRNPPSPPPVSTSASSSSYDYSPSKFLNLTGDPKEDSSTTATVVVILAVLLLFALFSIHIRRLRNQTPSLRRHNRPRQPSPPRPPSQRVVDIIKSLPVFSFRENAKYQSDCAICLGEFKENECVKLIPFCQHVYHPSCIDTWLSSHLACPMCRSTRLFKNEKRDDPGGKLRPEPEKVSVSQGASHSE